MGPICILILDIAEVFMIRIKFGLVVVVVLLLVVVMVVVVVVIIFSIVGGY